MRVIEVEWVSVEVRAELIYLQTVCLFGCSRNLRVLALYTMSNVD